MRVYGNLIVLALAIDASFGSPLQLHRRAGYEVKERSVLPPKWKRIAPAPADSSMIFSIGLKQSNFGELEKQLYEGG